MPTITVQPASVSAVDGTEAVFTVTVTGAGLSYQWYYEAPDDTDWTPVTSGGDKAALTVTAIAEKDNYKYYCEITNGTDTVKSKAATLTVTPRPPLPTIKAHPSSVTVVAGGSAVFTVDAEGEGLSYQWYAQSANATKWTKITENGSNAQYTVTALMEMNGSRYYCEVSNISGSVDSSAATLTVKQPAAPVITSQPASVKVVVNKTATFTVSAQGTGLTYQWYVQTKGATAWTPVGGATSAKLTVTATAALDGARYRCVVTGEGGQSVTSGEAALTVVTAPKITTQPKKASVKNGKKVTFKVKASGYDLKYQWYYQKPGTKKWVKMGGKTKATLSFTAKKNKNGYKYRCYVTNAAGTVKSKAVKLTVK